jgi:hypothetical protein
MAGSCADALSVATEIADDEVDALSVATEIADDEFDALSVATARNEDARMEEPGGKRVKDSWSKIELGALKRAVALHGRDWVAVASSVGSKTRQQCYKKFDKEVAAGRMQELGGKQAKDSWSKVELDALELAVARHGRDWVAVASSVGSKTIRQCYNKVDAEVAAGRMQELGGKRVLWSQVELEALKQAVVLHGRVWAAVASSVGSKTKNQCSAKFAREGAHHPLCAAPHGASSSSAA